MNNKDKKLLMIEQEKFHYSILKDFLFLSFDKYTSVVLGTIGFYLILIQIFIDYTTRLIISIIYLIVIISMIFLYNREYKKLLKELIKKEDEINEIYSKILK